MIRIASLWADLVSKYLGQRVKMLGVYPEQNFTCKKYLNVKAKGISISKGFVLLVGVSRWGLVLGHKSVSHRALIGCCAVTQWGQLCPIFIKIIIITEQNVFWHTQKLTPLNLLIFCHNPNKSIFAYLQKCVSRSPSKMDDCKTW